MATFAAKLAECIGVYREYYRLTNRDSEMSRDTLVYLYERTIPELETNISTIRAIVDRLRVSRSMKRGRDE